MEPASIEYADGTTEDTEDIYEFVAALEGSIADYDLSEEATVHRLFSLDASVCRVVVGSQGYSPAHGDFAEGWV